MGPEYREVELPFIQQLQAMGWGYVEGSLEDPAATGRDSFAQVIQEGVLREISSTASTYATASLGSMISASPRPSAP
jgi:type I restriction enzyme R subunit